MRALYLLTALILFKLPFKAQAEDQIIAAKFSGVEKGQAAITQRFHQGKHGWFLDQRLMVGDSNPFLTKSNIFPNFSCTQQTLGTIFQQLQLNAMNKYALTEYLSHPEIEKYLAQSLKVADRPISFYQYLSPHSSGEGLNGLIKIPGAEVNQHFTTYQNTRSDKVLEQLHVRGSLYSVSGQKMNSNVSLVGVKPDYVPLPWMMDQDFKSFIGNEFTREKYPLIFELGRANASGEGQHKALSAFAGKDMLKEVVQYTDFHPDAINLAHVSFQCLSEENVNKLLTKFPSATVLRAPRDPKNVAVIIVPLRTYLEVHNPKQILNSWQNFESAIGRPVPAEKIVAFLGQLKRHTASYVDHIHKGKLQQVPLHVSASGLGRNFLPAEMLGELYGFKGAEIRNLVDQSIHLGDRAAIRQGGFIEGHLMPETVKDPAFGPFLEKLNESHSIKISNLDPVQGRDPEYVISSIVAGFEHTARATLRGLPNADQLLNEYIAGMAKEKVTLAVTTQFPETAATLRRLGPVKSFSVDLKSDGPSHSWWDTMQKISSGKIKRPSEKLEVFVFNMQQMLQFQRMMRATAPQNPKLWPQANPGFHAWQAEVSEP